MKSLCRVVSIIFRLCLFWPALCLFSNLSSAQSPAVGMIEGRVFNPGTGGYLEFVHITVEGTSFDAFTDSSGQYRLTNVPAGEVRVKAFRTGVSVQTASVTVLPGRVAQQNFDLTDTRPTAATEGVVKLDQFVVNASKEMDGAAIAINTQRFAPNTMNVITADEFGPVADGGVGEALKSVPGIAVGRGPGFGDAYLVTLNGVPPNNVPVTIGGFDLAEASNVNTRVTGLQQTSINNFSRIEVIYTPTPETSGSALAGSINLIPISAFERAKPAYNLSVSMMMRDNARDFNETPGPLRERSRKILPGVDFSAIVPVNDRFGFTISGSASSLYAGTGFSQSGWRGASVVTNGGTLPDTTPDAPYLTDYTFGDNPVLSKRITLSATVDYKLSQNDRLFFSMQFGFSDAARAMHQSAFLVNRVLLGNFNLTSTHGFAGAGQVNMNNNDTKLGGNVYTPSITYRHDGPVWKAAAGAGFSRSDRYNKNLSVGNFAITQARLQGVTVSFDDNFYLRPGAITVTDGATGAKVDPYNIANYKLNTAAGDELRAIAQQRTAFANLRREFFGRVPLALKAGLDVRQSIRDTREPKPAFTFVGADRLPNTADDNAAAVFDEIFSQRTPPFGFPQVQWMSSYKLFDLYKSMPAYFTTNDATNHTAAVQLSKHAEEVISSAYLRADAKFFDGRLKLVGGVRAEQTNAKGEGQLIDPTRNLQRNASGGFVLGTNGLPAPITTDPLAAAQLTNIDRGLRAEKEYLRWFPSLNATFNIRENLIARAGYYLSVGRPAFSQYAGSLALPDTTNPPGPNNRISVNNVGIKAWSARTTKVSLEYYFERVGLLSISVFRRDIKNFFGNTVLIPTPEFLGQYGLDPAVYGAYDVSTQYNLPTPVRMTGVDLNYKQALTFLPNWARGVQVFANASAQRTIGDATANFAGYIPRTYNWGVSLVRTKYNVRMNWNYAGRQRQALVAAGRGIDPNTFTWGSKRLIIDLSGEYWLTKRIAAFANLANLNDAPIDLEISGPSTPAVAQFRQRLDFGSQWLFGIKAKF